MSILIKNMEMPKSCNECILEIEEACGLKAEPIPDYWSRLDRPSWCPLIEIKPHGDLIDRDELCKGLSNIHPVAKYANKMPTIIEAEVEDE